VQLASGSTFRTDQVALWLAELELGPDAYPLLETHLAFFEAAKRREKLKELLEPSDSQQVHLAPQDAGGLRGQRCPNWT
jgi:hypothetical protein